MPTRWWTGLEVAEVAERLVPGSVAKANVVACYFHVEKMCEAMEALRIDPETDFRHLTNLCGVDFWDHFEVVYHVQSFERNQFATLKVECWEREKASLPSVTKVWYGAWMQECEAYDLFGIRFEGHPNLHRILLWEGFPGWPLRKDFLSMPGGLQPGLSEFAGTARREAPPVVVIE
jgi:NADH-quinone oxidoreductase subunit C